MFFSLEKSVGAVVFRKKEGVLKYLILEYPHGHWGFSKGHVEAGETEKQTLWREVQEETGISDLKIIPEFWEKERYFYLARGEEREKRKRKGRGIMILKKVYYYLAETKQEEVKLSLEHKSYVWLEFPKALEKVTYRDDKNILKKADEFLLSSV